MQVSGRRAGAPGQGAACLSFVCVDINTVHDGWQSTEQVGCRQGTWRTLAPQLFIHTAPQLFIHTVPQLFIDTAPQLFICTACGPVCVPPCARSWLSTVYMGLARMGAVFPKAKEGWAFAGTDPIQAIGLDKFVEVRGGGMGW